MSTQQQQKRGPTRPPPQSMPRLPTLKKTAPCACHCWGAGRDDFFWGIFCGFVAPEASPRPPNKAAGRPRTLGNEMRAANSEISKFPSKPGGGFGGRGKRLGGWEGRGPSGSLIVLKSEGGHTSEVFGESRQGVLWGFGGAQGRAR